MGHRLNYNHLLYFWSVAREGGLAGAARALRLSPQTLSGQIRAFEDQVGQKLFTKSGRRLVLTERGRVAFRYADEIFSLGHELGDFLERGPVSESARLDVGLVEVLPKIMVTRLLEPALSMKPPVHLVCREGHLGALVAELAAHTLDVVFADRPLPPGGSVRAFSHLLGECGVTFLAAPALAARHREFPRGLDGAPFLAPPSGAGIRQQLEAFFTRHRVAPRIIGEVEDSALLKALGAEGHGILCAPTTVAREVAAMYGLAPIGETREIIERFYAITVERRIKNEVVGAISEVARTRLFA